ncbi:MAG: type II toxin-antitoxin system VapC family toxin [Acidimicrobiales bacterium]
MIVVDASVLIGHFDAADAHHDRATRLLQKAGEPLGASPISIAEVLVGPARAGQLDRATGALRELDVASVDFDQQASAGLAVLRARTNLKMPDCCVLLAAGQVNGRIATFDGRLRSAARELGIVVQDP